MTVLEGLNLHPDKLYLEMHLLVLKHYFSVVFKKVFSASENKQVSSKRVHFGIKLFCFYSNRRYLGDELSYFANQ